MRLATLLATAVFSISLFAAPSWAGIVIVSESRSFVDPGSRETTTVYLERDRMRVETKGPDGDRILIFRGDKGAFWSIDTAEGAYFEMTKESMQRMRKGIEEQMKGVREMMAEQMKGLSPEERKMLEQMGVQPMPFEPPSKPVYRKVASGVKVGRWRCDKYEGYQKGKKTEEVCAADLGQLGLSSEDLRLMDEMQKFTDSLAGGAESTGPKSWQEDQGYPGFPIMEASFSHGRMQEKTEVLDVRRQNLPASMFELPKGLKKMEEPLSQGMPSRRYR